MFTLRSPNEQEYGYFGYTVSGIPDFDRDGVDDFIVGVYGEYPGSSPWGVGRSYLFSGSDGSLLHTLKSPNEEGSGLFGSAVCGLSDTNGDMFGDFVIGAYYESPGTTIDYAGRAYLFQAPSRVLSITRLDLMDDDSIRDFDKSKLGGTGAGNGNFNSGDVYTIDKSAPFVPASVMLDNITPTNRDTVSFSVIFSESVRDSFNCTDITLLGTLAAGATVLVDGATSDSFKVLATPADPNADGTIGISITGEVRDASGNPLAVPLNSPLCTIRNYPGDKNDDGDVNAAELNEVILYYRDMLP